MAEGRESRLRQGYEALKRLGIDAGDASVESLERALGEDPSTALAVAEILGAVASEASLEALQRLEASAQDKLMRREVRRALYRLRQKGLAAAPPAPAAAETAPARALLGGPEPEGYLSLSDPVGDRLLWIAKPRAGGGLFHFSIVVNEPVGLKEAVLAEVARKSLRELRAELAARHHLRMVEVDWRYCDWIGAEGFERVRARGDMPESASHYPQLRMQLFTSPAKPTVLALPALGDDRPASLAASATLLEEDDLRSWRLTESALSTSLARYREIRDSPIVLDRSAQLGRIAEIVAGAIEEVFSGAGAESWQRRLAEAAHVFAKTDRRAPAAHAAAVAEALAAQGNGSGIPFCEELVRRSFAAFFAQEAEREREERASSVLVTPDDIRAEQARARQRSPR